MTDTTNKTPTEILAPDVVTPEVVPAQAPKQGKPASLWTDAWRELRRKPGFVISALLVILMTIMAAFPQLFTSIDPRECSLINALQTPGAEHWFGTDLQGCDYYARTIYGARTSVSIGLVVTFVATLIAVTLGSLAGYKGGWLDSTLSRFTDIMFAIPLILGAIVILNALGGSRGIWTVSAVLIILGWPTMLRLMRSSVLSVLGAGLCRRRPRPGRQRLADHHPSRPPQWNHPGHRLRHHHCRCDHHGRGEPVLPQRRSPTACHLLGADDLGGAEPHPDFPPPPLLPRGLPQCDRFRLHSHG